MNRSHDFRSSGPLAYLLIVIGFSACLAVGCGEKKAAAPAAPAVEVVHVAEAIQLRLLDREPGVEPPPAASVGGVAGAAGA